MDKALKQRLVGASVLIALAVIVLPMLLGGRPEGASPEPEKIEFPEEPPELSFETRRYPIGETADQRKGENEPERDAEKTPSPLPTPKIPSTTEITEPPVISEESGGNDLDVTGLGPAPGDRADPELTNEPPVQSPEAAVTESAPPASEPDMAPMNPPSSAGRYIVQVASFGAANNANRLSGQLREGGYSVMTDTVKSDVGTLHRVRVGPFDTEAEARQAVAALSSTIDGIKPRVMDLQPEQAAQVTTPEDPLVRWVVQVGSFSSSANAENVVAKLRLNGMSAYQETVSSGGKDIFRVRVGPFLNRQDAMDTEREVSESLSVKAVVMTTD
jgi:DedD protein